MRILRLIKDFYLIKNSNRCVLSRKYSIKNSCFDENYENLLNDFNFKAKFDRYGGLHYESQSSKSNEVNFDKVFRTIAIESDRFQKIIVENFVPEKLLESPIRTIWFRIDKSKSRLITPLVELDFKFHHARNDHVVLYKKIDGNNNVPQYAYTNVGVGKKL